MQQQEEGLVMTETLTIMKDDKREDIRRIENNEGQEQDRGMQ